MPDTGLMTIGGVLVTLGVGVALTVAFLPFGPLLGFGCALGLIGISLLLVGGLRESPAPVVIARPPPRLAAYPWAAAEFVPPRFCHRCGTELRFDTPDGRPFCPACNEYR